jgi:hypothetical protein
MKILELLAVTPDEQLAALAIVPAMFISMRMLYGAWPWEGRKTWYRTKPFVPVMALPEQINSEAKETPVDTESDHFDRKLMAANGDSPTSENAPSTSCETGGAPSALRKKEPLTRGPKSTVVKLGIWGIELPTTAVQVLMVITT